MQIVFDTKHVKRRWVFRSHGMPCTSAAATDYEAVTRSKHMKRLGCGWTYVVTAEMSEATYRRAQAGETLTLT